MKLRILGAAGEVTGSCFLVETGAGRVLEPLATLGALRIAYVSCNPATLASDAAELVNRHGYRLAAAGAVDMFPHTAHVESMALFVKRGASG